MMRAQIEYRRNLLGVTKYTRAAAWNYKWLIEENVQVQRALHLAQMLQ